LKRVTRALLVVLAACGREEAQPPDGWIVPLDDAGADVDLGDAGADACTRKEGCATSVAAGRHLACAIKDGAVYCWGSTDYGALGTKPSGQDSFDYMGNERYRSSPQRIDGVPNPATRVVAGDEFACTLSQVGQVWCWGKNDSGQLGHTTALDDTCARQDGGDRGACTWMPSIVDGLSTDVHVVDLVAGDRAVCARTDDGDVYCWGSNAAGVAGQPLKQANLLSAHLVATNDLAKRASQIAMALDEPFACALRDDTTVWCWGDDRSGRVGRDRGTLDGCDGGCTAKPTQVLESDGGAMSGVLRIAIGGASACAQSASDVRCWGGNELGELARGTWDTDPHPLPAIAKVPSGSTALVGRGNTYFARDAYGRNLIWGRDEEGQMGTGEGYGAGTLQTQPCNQFNWQSPALSGFCFGRAQVLTTTFVTLAPGHQFVAAIDPDGAVWAWGDEAAGEIGEGVTFTGSCDPNGWPPVSCELKPQLVF
jgi:alpha-tubulin suppressor-like RCC1 family protein